MFAATGMITVGPSAPWDTETAHRWCLASADEYLADVIEECKARFNIDPDCVFLIGHSMGGFGAFHHVQRSPDRFAAVIANSGSWDRAYWPAIRGTPLCIVQGAHDAEAGVRWHYTDIAYGRWTDKLLNADGIEHTYLEHDGHHSICFGKPLIAKYFESAKDLRRDPYYPHIVLASPVGYGSSYCFGVEDNRWLTLDETTPGDLVYDEMRLAFRRHILGLVARASHSQASRRCDRSDQSRRQSDRGDYAERRANDRLAPSADDRRCAAGLDRGQRPDAIQRKADAFPRHFARVVRAAERLGTRLPHEGRASGCAADDNASILSEFCPPQLRNSPRTDSLCDLGRFFAHNRHKSRCPRLRQRP